MVRSSRTAGRASRANGRSWSRMIGVVWRRNGRVWRSAGPSSRAVGRSASIVGPSSSASVVVLPSVVSACCSVGGSSRSAARRFWSCAASAWKLAFDESTSSASCVSFSPSSSVSRRKLWMTRLVLRRRSASSLVIFSTSRPVGSKRLNVSRRSAG